MRAATPNNSKRTAVLFSALLTLVAISFHVIHLCSGGALWRDEAAVVQLATSAPVAEVFQRFPHEAFPPPYFLFLRCWGAILGPGDLSFRILGLLVGVAILGSIWWVCWTIKKDTPTIAIALIGFNAAFLMWGDEVRGYGCGVLFIILFLGLMWRLVGNPTWQPATGISRGQPGRDDFHVVPIKERIEGQRESRPYPTLWRTLAATVGAVCASQVLLHNFVLVSAICCGACAVALKRRRERTILNIATIWVVTLLCLLPYAGPLGRGRDWDIVVRTGAVAQSVSSRLIEAMGASGVWNVVFWIGLLLAVLGLAALATVRSGVSAERRRSSLGKMRRSADAPLRSEDLLLYCGVVTFASVAFYLTFLSTLKYPTQPWYYLALLSVVAVSIDLALGGGCRDRSPVSSRFTHHASRITHQTVPQMDADERRSDSQPSTINYQPSDSESARGAEERKDGHSFPYLTQLTYLTYLTLFLALIIALSSLPLTWGTARNRMTNIDVIADRLRHATSKGDLVVVMPWQLGISFNRYYRASAEWMTIPPIPFHLYHRYDLVKEWMIAPDQDQPIQPALDKIKRALERGHAVYVVTLLPAIYPVESVPILIPAPNGEDGWNEQTHTAGWCVKTLAYIQSQSLSSKVLVPNQTNHINRYEDLALTRFSAR